MYGDRIFIRTREGDAALAERGFRDFSYRVHMVLKLCDGTHRYDFLEANLRRVDNLADIFRHLIENSLVEEVRAAGRGAPPAQGAAVARPEPARERAPAPAPRVESPPQRDVVAGSGDRRVYFRAIAEMSDALAGVFSDEVLQWSMDAEDCDDPRTFAALVKRFEALYAQQAGRKRAQEFMAQLAKNNPTTKVA